MENKIPRLCCGIFSLIKLEKRIRPESFRVYKERLCKIYRIYIHTVYILPAIVGKLNSGLFAVVVSAVIFKCMNIYIDLFLILW